jgi:TolB-like protein/Tfp pilus assembly protein PilF
MAAVVALAFAWFWQGRPQDAVLPNSVAVLPFADESADPSQPWIVDSLHIEIISKLGQLGLNVINREAVLAYLQNNAPSHAEIAAAFRVRSILVGTIRYADDQVRVEARLVDPATDVDLWSLAPHQSHLLSVFEAEAAIATSVATRLNAEFSVAEQRRIETRPTVSLNAAQRYYEALAGLYRESRTDTLRLLKEATELDPTFALAHSQLALLRARSSIDWGTDPAGALTPEEFAQEVRASAERALHLDGGSTIASAIAHAALGELNMYSWRWTEAESDLAKAFELGGNGPDLPIYYAEFLTFRGKYDAALPMAERYAELNPTLPDPYARTHTPSLWFIWLAHVYAGNTDEAIEYLGQHLRLRPNDWAARLNLGFTELHRKNYGAAEAAFDSVERVTAGRRSPTNAAALAYVYARIGRTEKAMHLFQEIQKTSDPVSDGTWALAYLAIGDRAHSLERLDGAIERIKRHEPDAGWFNLMMFKHNLTGDPTLDEPEFRERREQIAGT